MRNWTLPTRRWILSLVCPREVYYLPDSPPTHESTRYTLFGSIHVVIICSNRTISSKRSTVRSFKWCRSPILTLHQAVEYRLLQHAFTRSPPGCRCCLCTSRYAPSWRAQRPRWQISFSRLAYSQSRTCPRRSNNAGPGREHIHLEHGSIFGLRHVSGVVQFP